MQFQREEYIWMFYSSSSWVNTQSGLSPSSVQMRQKSATMSLPEDFQLNKISEIWAPYC